MNEQMLIDDFKACHPEYKGKTLEIQIHDDVRYDIDLIKKKGKLMNYYTVTNIYQQALIEKSAQDV